MSIAIVAALQEELSAVLALAPLQERGTVELGGREHRLGSWAGQPVVTVLSRIGKVAAASTATALITHFQARAIVFTGVAGGLGDGVQVGDVVVAREFLQHDMDASPLFPQHEVPLTGKSRFQTDPALSDALCSAVRQGLPQARLHEGLVISGDRFVSSSDEAQTLRRHIPDALAVEMEGAAIAQVCHDFGVPFAAVRTISDRADDAASVDFQNFITTVASPYSAAILGELMARWSAQR
jgi:adenosylhomocysteine nucleosidase